MRKNWGLDFLTIELIVVAAREGSISRAAKRTHIALAAASRRISDFEKRIGFRVFERQARGVKVTSEAEPLLHYISTLLAGLDTLSSAVEDLRSGVTDHLRLLANNSVIVELLPELLAKFIAKNPKVRIEVEELSSLEVVRAVVERRGSIGTLWADIGTQGLETTPIGGDDMIIVVPRTHVLAKLKSIRFADTLAHDFVLFDSYSPLYMLLAREAGKLNATLKGRIRVRGLDAVCTMVEAGLGIGVMPRRAAQTFAKSMRIHLVNLEEPWAHRQFCAAYRSDVELAPVERSFIVFAEREWAQSQARK